MIDIKKLLEGIPGLLLMAALILFGATIGVTTALALSWVEMKDSMANFLGGVVGAGLGSSLAVMGAVYVWQQERSERLKAPLDRLRSVAGLLHYEAKFLAGQIEEGRESEEHTGRLFQSVAGLVKGWPDSSGLPAVVHLWSSHIKDIGPFQVQALADALNVLVEDPADDAKRQQALSICRRLESQAANLREAL